MPIDVPTRLTLKWWKKNYPKSMPTNREAETLIRQFEETPPDVLAAQLDGLINDMADGAMARVTPVIKEAGAIYVQLHEQLKRTKAMLTKEKHTELAQAMDTLAAKVKEEQIRVGKVTRAAQKRVLEAQGNKKSGINWDDRAKSLDKEYFDLLTTFHTEMAKIARKADTITDDDDMDRKEKAEAMAEVVGKNRFIASEIGKKAQGLDRMMKEAEKQIAKTPNSLEAQSFLADAKAGRPKFAAVARESELLDKELVRACIAVLGDSLGKKLFMAATPVKVRT